MKSAEKILCPRRREREKLQTKYEKKCLQSVDDEFKRYTMRRKERRNLRSDHDKYSMLTGEENIENYS